MYDYQSHISNKNEQQGEVYIRKDTTKLKFWSHVAPLHLPPGPKTDQSACQKY